MSKKNRKSDSRKANKSVAALCHVWWRKDKESIHIRIGDSGMTTVSRRVGARYHRHLFNKLAAVLREAGRPAPDPL